MNAKPSKNKFLCITMLVCMIFFAGTLPLFGQDQLQITADKSGVSVNAGDMPVLRYQLLQRPAKPYVEQLFSPGGVNMLRDSPADHKHHHGLMFAVAVDGLSFWQEHSHYGVQKHRSLGDVKTFVRDGLTWAAFTQQLDWVDPKSEKPLLHERRTIEVCRTKKPKATLLIWRTCLQPPQGKDSVTLTGSNYYGLGMRFVESMDKVGRFFNADGKDGRPARDSQRLVRSRWCAYTAPADGKPVTVAIFDHPENPRHPAVMFTMPKRFAYLSATLNLWKEPLVIKAGQPLTLQYAVVLCDGHVEPAQIEQLYQEWITKQ